MGEISQADLIRQDIETKLAAGYDFSKSSLKQSAVKEFIESHPELETTVAKLQKAYYPILKEYAKKQGVNIASNKKRLLKPNESMLHGDMDTTISPVPQIVQPQIQQPMMNQESVQPVHTMTIEHDIAGVSASINAFYLVVKTVFAPQAELLTEEEKKSLGSIWLPIFNKYLQNEKSVILVAVASSIGIVAPKLVKGRKLKKEKDAEKNEDPNLEDSQNES